MNRGHQPNAKTRLREFFRPCHADPATGRYDRYKVTARFTLLGAGNKHYNCVRARNCYTHRTYYYTNAEFKMRFIPTTDW